MRRTGPAAQFFPPVLTIDFLPAKRPALRRVLPALLAVFLPLLSPNPAWADDAAVVVLEKNASGTNRSDWAEGMSAAVGFLLENFGNLEFNLSLSSPSPGPLSAKTACDRMDRGLFIGVLLDRKKGGGRYEMTLKRCPGGASARTSGAAKFNDPDSLGKTLAREALKFYDPSIQPFFPNGVPGNETFQAFSKGVSAFRVGDLDSAKRFMESALKAAPGYRDPHFFMGRYFYMDRQILERAVSHFEKAVESSTRDFRALYFLGLALELNDPNRAAGFFERAKAVNPKNEEVYLRLGDLYKNELFALDKAEENFEALLDRDRNNAMVWYLLACARALNGRRAEALEALGKAIALDPEFRNAAKVDFDLKTLRSTNEFKRMVP